MKSYDTLAKYAVAIVVLFAFWQLVLWLFGRADATEAVWTRYMILFKSVETLMVAAAGAVFGTVVQRQQVQAAQANAKEQQKRADQNAKVARKGQQVAFALKSVSRPVAEGAEMSAMGAQLDSVERLADEVLAAEVL